MALLALQNPRGANRQRDGAAPPKRTAAAARLLLALLMLLLGGMAPAYAAPKFPALSGRVVDQAGILSPATEQTLTDKLAALETKTGRQFVVVTLADLQGYEIADYGYQLGRAWGIGAKDADDGVLLIVAPAERKVRIEVGYGLEAVLTDALSSVILQERVLPKFRAGDMEGGVVDGADAIIDQLSLDPEAAKAKVEAAAAAPETGAAFPYWIALLIGFWLITGLLRAMSAGRRRRRYGSSADWLIPWIIFSGSGRDRDGWGGGGGDWGGGGGGGFSGGGGSFGGGGSSGSW